MLVWCRRDCVSCVYMDAEAQVTFNLYLWTENGKERFFLDGTWEFATRENKEASAV